MNITFSALCSVEVTHAYYGGRCPDVAFVIPSDSGASLRRGRLLVKPFDGRLFVLFEAAEDGGPLVSATGTVIRAGLAITNPSFGNFTSLSFTPGSTIAVYDNQADPTQLGAPVASRLTGPVFTHDLAHDERPVDVALKSAAGATIAAATITAAANQPSCSFDLTRYSPGRYTVTEAYPANVTASASYYVDAELVQESLSGIVEIAIAEDFYDTAAVFHVPFDTRAETLRYYVVARNYSVAEFNSLSVVDSGFADDQRPQVTFVKVQANDFAAGEVPASLLGDADSRVVLIRSNAPVPRRASGRQRLELKRNGDVIIGNLPQPGPERPTADLIVHLGKPKP